MTKPPTRPIKTIKGVNVAKLNTRQKKAMKRHSKHHTSEHIRKMRDLILAGKTFSQAHTQAMATVGK